MGGPCYQKWENDSSQFLKAFIGYQDDPDYVEVIELHSADAKGGTYVLRHFPKVRPYRRFDWEPTDGPPPDPENTNGADFLEESDSAVLSNSRLVRVTDEKAPRIGLEPATTGLTAANPHA